MSATTVLLSMPFAFLLGLLIAGLVARVQFIRAEQTFRCRIRITDYPFPSSPEPWPRRRMRATWVHDVLVVHRGVLHSRTLTFAVRGADGALRSSCQREISRLGAQPVVLSLQLDDERKVDIAAPHSDRTALVGPFLTAAIHGLPQAPSEPRRRTN